MRNKKTAVSRASNRRPRRTSVSAEAQPLSIPSDDAKERYERCVLDVKKQQESFNLKKFLKHGKYDQNN